MDEEMTEGDAAVDLGGWLDTFAEDWTVVAYDLGEIHATNEAGEKFLLTVQKVDKFPDED